MVSTQYNVYFGEKNRKVLSRSIHRKAHIIPLISCKPVVKNSNCTNELSILLPRQLFWCFLCDFVILCLLQMKSFPSFLTSCEVGKTSGRSPARLGLIIISTNFDQIYRTLCHQTAASH